VRFWGIFFEDLLGFKELFWKYFPDYENCVPDFGNCVPDFNHEQSDTGHAFFKVENSLKIKWS
jgi:hypothetical protein